MPSAPRGRRTWLVVPYRLLNSNPHHLWLPHRGIMFVSCLRRLKSILPAAVVVKRASSLVKRKPKSRPSSAAEDVSRRNTISEDTQESPVELDVPSSSTFSVEVQVEDSLPTVVTTPGGFKGDSFYEISAPEMPEVLSPSCLLVEGPLFVVPTETQAQCTFSALFAASEEESEDSLLDDITGTTFFDFQAVSNVKSDSTANDIAHVKSDLPEVIDPAPRECIPILVVPELSSRTSLTVEIQNWPVSANEDLNASPTMDLLLFFPAPAPALTAAISCNSDVVASYASGLASIVASISSSLASLSSVPTMEILNFFPTPPPIPKDFRVGKDHIHEPKEEPPTPRASRLNPLPAPVARRLSSLESSISHTDELSVSLTELLDELTASFSEPEPESSSLTATPGTSSSSSITANLHSDSHAYGQIVLSVSARNFSVPDLYSVSTGDLGRFLPSIPSLGSWKAKMAASHLEGIALTAEEAMIESSAHASPSLSSYAESNYDHGGHDDAFTPIVRGPTVAPLSRLQAQRKQARNVAPTSSFSSTAPAPVSMSAPQPLRIIKRTHTTAINAIDTIKTISTEKAQKRLSPVLEVDEDKFSAVTYYHTAGKENNIHTPLVLPHHTRRMDTRNSTRRHGRILSVVNA